MIAGIVLWVVVAFLVAVGAIHLAGGKAIREAYAAWRYPPNFHLVTGLLEMAAAVLLAFPATRIWGLALAAAVTLAALLTLLRHRQVSHLPAPLLLATGLFYLYL